MSRLSRWLWGRLRLTDDERRHTDRQYLAAVTHKSEARLLSNVAEEMRSRNNFAHKFHLAMKGPTS